MWALTRWRRVSELPQIFFFFNYLVSVSSFNGISRTILSLSNLTDTVFFATLATPYNMAIVELRLNEPWLLSCARLQEIVRGTQWLIIILGFNSSIPKEMFLRYCVHMITLPNVNISSVNTPRNCAKLTIFNYLPLISKLG